MMSVVISCISLIFCLWSTSVHVLKWSWHVWLFVDVGSCRSIVLVGTNKVMWMWKVMLCSQMIESVERSRKSWNERRRGSVLKRKESSQTCEGLWQFRWTMSLTPVFEMSFESDIRLQENRAAFTTALHLFTRTHSSTQGEMKLIRWS